MTKGEGARQRTARAIMDSAAAILAERGEAASMEEIAASAGIGRATLYRYFQNREELLAAMTAASVEELAVRIEQANLEAIPFDEGIARLSRAVIAAGSKYVALSADTVAQSDAYPDFHVRVTEPIRSLFRRGLADGSLRVDLPLDVLVELFSGLLKSALDTTTFGGRGIEETAAAVTSVFLRGVSAS